MSASVAPFLLPTELLVHILKFLDPSSRKAAGKVCRHWRSTIQTYLCSELTVTRALEGPSNLRFNNADWRILAVPMIDMARQPAVCMHGALVRVDGDPTVRKNNIESVHRSTGADSCLMTPRQLAHLQETRDPVFFRDGELHSMQAQLVIPHAFTIRYKFKLSFAALLTFPGFSRSVSRLHELCRVHSGLSFSVQNEPFLQGDEVKSVLMEDENLFALSDLDAVLEQSTSCVLSVSAACTPKYELLQRLVQVFWDTVPYTRRARTLFVHASELKLVCQVPKRVPFEFVAVCGNKRRQFSRAWRMLYDKITPPHVTVAARRSFLQAIKDNMFEKIYEARRVLSRGGVPVYPSMAPHVSTGFNHNHACMFIHRHIQTALSLYVYRGVRVMPVAPVHMALYTMHCVAWNVSVDPARQDGRLAVRVGSPAPLGPMQQRSLDTFTSHLYQTVAGFVV
jgi:hypothetical protein